MALILIFYACVTNYLLTGSLKQHPFISPQSVIQQSCGSTVFSVSGSHTQGAAWAQFLFGGLESSSRLTQLWAWRQLQDWVPVFLLTARDCSQQVEATLSFLPYSLLHFQSQCQRMLRWFKSLSHFKCLSPGLTEEFRSGQLWHRMWSKHGKGTPPYSRVLTTLKGRGFYKSVDHCESLWHFAYFSAQWIRQSKVNSTWKI